MTDWFLIDSAPKEDDFFAYNMMTGSYRTRATKINGRIEYPLYELGLSGRAIENYPRPTHWRPIFDPPVEHGIR